MAFPTPLVGYKSFQGLPSLAGLCTVEDAAKPGLGVEECVRRLKRFHYAFKRLHQILTARITAEPIYELKTAFAHHAYLCAEHATSLRTRIGEMREPPLGLEDVPHPALEAFFDEILAAPTTEELIYGLYVGALGPLGVAIEKYQCVTHPLTDAPSRRVLKFALLELHEMFKLGFEVVVALGAAAKFTNDWESVLGSLVDAAGGIDGTEPVRREGQRPETARGFTPKGWDNLAQGNALGTLREANPGADAVAPLQGAKTTGPGTQGVALGYVVPPLRGEQPSPPVAHAPGSPQDLPRRYSATPYVYDPVPRRDERFTDPWNQGVNAEAFLYDEAMPARAKALMMLYKRLREIDVPEMMASIITQTPGKPWGYYRDMSRQLWDEARHAMMGEVGFVALGVDWTKAKITFNWSYRLNTECTPTERHGVLYFIEQGLMPKTGKRYEFETGQRSGLPLIATIQDFDWADEVLHSQIGRQWYVPEFGTLQKALEYGDKAWSKVLSNWAEVKAKGLTDHANWWPAVYRQACAAEGVEPDAAVLAFAETYEGKRADLKRVAAE